MERLIESWFEKFRKENPKLANGWVERDHEVILFDSPEKAEAELKRIGRTTTEYATCLGLIIVKSIGFNRFQSEPEPTGYLRELKEWATLMAPLFGGRETEKREARSFERQGSD